MNSPVEFAHEYLCPSPEASDAVSFGLDDVLLTAAFDSEDFGPALADALPASVQEARPSAAYSELMDMLSRTTEKLSIDRPHEPHESQSSKLEERFLSGPNSRPERRKLQFFSDLHHEISRYVVFLDLSAFGHILLGAWLPLKLFLEGSPMRIFL